MIESSGECGIWHNSRLRCKHQYILQKEQPELFKELAWKLRASLFTEKYKKCTYKVTFINELKYWRMGDVINRKPMTDQEAEKVARKELFLGEVQLDQVSDRADA